jgi:hypothetical protein
MDDDTLMRLQTEGAAAQARGAEVLDNPMYRTENLALAEVDFALWEAKAAAWESGWRTPPARRRGDFRSGAERP